MEAKTKNTIVVVSGITFLGSLTMTIISGFKMANHKLSPEERDKKWGKRFLAFGALTAISGGVVHSVVGEENHFFQK